MTGYPSVDKTHEKSVPYLKRHPIIPNCSFYHVLKLISVPYRKRTALQCMKEQVSFAELFNRVDVLSKSLRSLGIKENDIVVAILPNCIQGVELFLAVNRIGAVMTFLDSFLPAAEIEYYLKLFHAPIVICHDDRCLHSVDTKRLVDVKHIIIIDKKDAGRESVPDDKTISFKKLLQIGSNYRGNVKSNYNGKRDALILFTSGSTGDPKPVVLTNDNLLATGIYLKNSSNTKSSLNEKCLVCVPFCYPYGFVTSTLMSLLCGRTAILAPNLTKDNISYFLSQRPNMVFGSPALLELIRRNVPEHQDLSSIHTYISGGDYLAAAQILEGQKFFTQHHAKVDICNGSGNAETCGSGTNPVGQKLKITTVGKVLIGPSVMILNRKANRECRYGEEGQLCISGRNVFKEYYGKPEMTSEAKFLYKGKEYFKTGTRGILDEEGYFTLTGRDSRYYIMSTLNKVYCDRVQNILSTFEQIAACAVVKMVDKELLYVNKAFVVLKENVPKTKKTMELIMKQCTEPVKSVGHKKVDQLKSYEIPAEIEFIDQLPRTRADKIDYLLLEKMCCSKG